MPLGTDSDGAIQTARASNSEPRGTDVKQATPGDAGSIDSSEPMQNLHSCFLIDIILNFIVLIIIII